MTKSEDNKNQLTQPTTETIEERKEVVIGKPLVYPITEASLFQIFHEFVDVSENIEAKTIFEDRNEVRFFYQMWIYLMRFCVDKSSEKTVKEGLEFALSQIDFFRKNYIGVGGKGRNDLKDSLSHIITRLTQNQEQNRQVA